MKRALFGLFQGAVGEDVVSRARRKVKFDWDAGYARSFAEARFCDRSGGSRSMRRAVRSLNPALVAALACVSVRRNAV